MSPTHILLPVLYAIFLRSAARFYSIRSKQELPKRRKMGRARHLFGAVRRTFIGFSCKTAAVLDVDDGKLNYLEIQNVSTQVSNIATSVEDYAEDWIDGRDQGLSNEDLAAIIIQAYFRGHLARRAYRALKSLVKVQAVVRGVCARRQAHLAVHCMQALVRLQVRVRARQLLIRKPGCEKNLS